MKCRRCGGRTAERPVPTDLLPFIPSGLACKTCQASVRGWVRSHRDAIQSVRKSFDGEFYTAIVKEVSGNEWACLSFTSDEAREEFLSELLPRAEGDDPESALCFLDSHDTKAV